VLVEVAIEGVLTLRVGQYNRARAESSHAGYHEMWPDTWLLVNSFSLVPDRCPSIQSSKLLPANQYFSMSPCLKTHKVFRNFPVIRRNWYSDQYCHSGRRREVTCGLQSLITSSLKTLSSS
jgi:hypothetical protein